MKGKTFACGRCKHQWKAKKDWYDTPTGDGRPRCPRCGNLYGNAIYDNGTWYPVT